MAKLISNFVRADSGAVTVDWVVLTAALVGLGLATMAVVSSGVENVSGDIDGQLKSDDIIFSSFAPEPLVLPVDQARYNEMYAMLGEMPANHFVSNDMYDEFYGNLVTAAANGDAEAYAANADRLQATWDYWNNEVGGPSDGELSPDEAMAAHPLT